MPVQSKPLARKPPPIPAPKPILKKPLRPPPSPPWPQYRRAFSQPASTEAVGPTPFPRSPGSLGAQPTSPGLGSPTPFPRSTRPQPASPVPGSPIRVLRSPGSQPPSPGPEIPSRGIRSPRSQPASPGPVGPTPFPRKLGFTHGEEAGSPAHPEPEAFGLTGAGVGLKGGSRCDTTPIRQTIESQLQECEEHTDWANEILRGQKLPQLTDLRRSVGDGFTLPALIGIISNASVRCVKHNPTSREDRLENLEKCLSFLDQQHVDIVGIDASDLEDGNLKSVLHLIGNIRRRFDSSYTAGVNGNVASPSSPDSPLPSLTPRRSMPGTVKLPGAVPTPFLASRDPSPTATRNDVPGSPTRRLAFSEDFLPGSLNKDPVPSQPLQKPHSALISTTELGNNGVAQHGVEERRQHIAVTARPSTGTAGPVTSSKGSVPQGEPSLPAGARSAWSASPRPQVPKASGMNLGNSVEDRLRELIRSSGGDQRPGRTPTPGSMAGSRDNLGDGGGSGGGGTHRLDDGELLIVPPPISRNSPDFDVMMNNHGYGPGYRPHMTSQPMSQRSNRTYGYVPSKPSERRNGPRSEVILDRQPKQSPVLRSSQLKPAQPAQPGPAGSTLPGGQDNYAFTHDTPAPGHGGKTTPDQAPAEQSRGPVRQPGGNDLRNAWNKLYGLPVQPSPYNGQSPALNRGNVLRSSYGAQTQAPIRPHNFNPQHSVKFAPDPTHKASSRPLSAPILDQSQASVSMDTSRTSPVGQSSSTQGQFEESSSSQLSMASQGAVAGGQLSPASTFDTARKSSLSSPSSPNSPGSPNYAIGPAAKYPEMGSRPSSGRTHAVGQGPGSPGHNHTVESLHSSRQNVALQGLVKQPDTSQRSVSARERLSRTGMPGDSPSFRKATGRVNLRGRGLSYSFDGTEYSGVDVKDSIFDYEASHSESSSRSVTPPLPPLSNDMTPPESPPSSPSPNLPRASSASKMPPYGPTDLQLPSGVREKSDIKKPKHSLDNSFQLETRLQNPPSRRMHTQRSGPFKHSKGASGGELRDIHSDTDSSLSFDIENTILTVESHDTEQPPMVGEVLTSHEAAALRQQLNNLQTMYSDLQTKVASDKVAMPPAVARPRRWSIGSSDTSSFRREAKYKPGKHAHHRHHSREFKNINKRFQRLESHVVTLARSVAHLSSELRTHNMMVHDLDSLKKELKEMKEGQEVTHGKPLGSKMTEMERFRDWAPSLTNPKRVNKLTKFFGAEPPLLELFLEKLGYERYVSNFQMEHIGMIELPYMSEDRLEKIGVPMGPRLRILREAQMCFRKENFSIYIV